MKAKRRYWSTTYDCISSFPLMDFWNQSCLWYSQLTKIQEQPYNEDPSMTPLHQQMDIAVSKHQPAIVLVANNIFQDRLYCILNNHLIDPFPNKDGKDGERLSELTHDLLGPCPTQSFAFKINFKFGCLPLTCHLHGQTPSKVYFI